MIPVFAFLFVLELQAPAADAAKTFSAARERWNRRRPMAYEMTVDAFCLLPGGCRPQRFRVYGPDASHDLETLTANQREFYARLDSVDEIFDLIGNAIAGGAAHVSVAYDAEYGFPRSVDIRFSPPRAGDARRLSITELVSISPIEPHESATSTPALNVIDAPIRMLGHTASSVIAYLKQEPSDSELIPLVDIPGVLPYGLLRLDYGGFVVTMHIHTREPASRLFRLDVYDPAALATLGLALPLTREAARRLLGTPYLEAPTHWLYQPKSGMIDGRTLRLTFQGERLTRATWTWFVE